VTSRAQDDDGVVLVEVLVAFAILIGVITAGFQIFGDGLSRSRLAADRAARVAEAAAVFTALPDNIKPGTTTVQSTIVGRDFEVKVESLQGSAPANASRRPVLVQIFDAREDNGPPLYATVVLAGGGV
jgi:hypothetical protein